LNGTTPPPRGTYAQIEADLKTLFPNATPAEIEEKAKNEYAKLLRPGGRS
jgi:hypothetical protein